MPCTNLLSRRVRWAASAKVTHYGEVVAVTEAGQIHLYVVCERDSRIRTIPATYCEILDGGE